MEYKCQKGLTKWLIWETGRATVYSVATLNSRWCRLCCGISGSGRNKRITRIVRDAVDAPSSTKTSGCMLAGTLLRLLLLLLLLMRWITLMMMVVVVVVMCWL